MIETSPATSSALQAVLALAGPYAGLLFHAERACPDGVFTGVHHTLALHFTGVEAMPAAEAFILRAPDALLDPALPFLADAVIVHVDRSQSPAPSVLVTLKLITGDKPMSDAAPRSLEAATTLLERYASLEGLIGLQENARNDAIAAANKVADEGLAPLIEERDAIRAQLEPWWKQAAPELTGGKRKSAELGGCMIGTRSSSESLQVAGDEDSIITKLGKRAWAADLLVVTTKLDKKAILKALAGQYGKQLHTLGLRRNPPVDAFFVKRAEQSGTRAGA